MLLSALLDKQTSHTYRIILTQPERHSNLNRTFGVTTKLVTWLINNVKQLNSQAEILRQVLQNDERFGTNQTLSALQEHILRQFETNNNVFIKLYDHVKGDDQNYEEIIREHTIICDFTGGRHKWISEHSALLFNGNKNATQNWINTRGNQNNYYGIGKFNLHDSEISTGKTIGNLLPHTQSYYDNENKQSVRVWNSYDIEICSKLPAAVFKPKNVHLICGSGLVKTDAFFNQTLFLGVLSSLGILQVCLQHTHNVVLFLPDNMLNKISDEIIQVIKTCDETHDDVLLLSKEDEYKSLRIDTEVELPSTNGKIIGYVKDKFINNSKQHIILATPTRVENRINDAYLRYSDTDICTNCNKQPLPVLDGNHGKLCEPCVKNFIANMVEFNVEVTAKQAIDNTMRAFIIKSLSDVIDISPHLVMITSCKPTETTETIFQYIVKLLIMPTSDRTDLENKIEADISPTSNTNVSEMIIKHATKYNGSDCVSIEPRWFGCKENETTGFRKYNRCSIQIPAPSNYWCKKTLELTIDKKVSQVLEIFFKNTQNRCCQCKQYALTQQFTLYDDGTFFPDNSDAISENKALCLQAFYTMLYYDVCPILLLERKQNIKKNIKKAPQLQLLLKNSDKYAYTYEVVKADENNITMNNISLTCSLQNGNKLHLYQQD